VIPSVTMCSLINLSYGQTYIVTCTLNPVKLIVTFFFSNKTSESEYDYIAHRPAVLDSVRTMQLQFYTFMGNKKIERTKRWNTRSFPGIMAGKFQSEFLC